MNSKMESYINSLFTGVPRTRQATDLRDELLGNMQERYDDYLREGKSESQAYSLTVANMGDIDDLIAEVRPDDEFRREAQFYRTRNARNTAIGVALYILGAAVLIGFEAFPYEIFETLGVVILLVLVALATGLIVYTNMSTPVAYKDYDEQENLDREFARTPKGQQYKAIMSIYWSVITIVYLAISFPTGLWHITWIVWPVAGIISGIVHTIYQLRNSHE